MEDKLTLGERMKVYEGESKTYLEKKIPVIIRLDGKAFHTFTKGLKKPFDEVVLVAMEKTMQFLCKEIQGCVFGYTQSDEITLVLADYTNPETSAWFDYNVQKICSVSASIATAAFNRFFREEVIRWENSKKLLGLAYTAEDENLRTNYWSKVKSCAMFDSRCFNLSKEEVVNCIIWRQRDAVRNSIQALAQTLYSPKELWGKTSKELKEKMEKECDVYWDSYFNNEKWGAACYHTLVNGDKYVPTLKKTINVTRKEWIIDDNMPLVVNKKEYVERWL